jgi:multidrug resistance efflux pump
VLLVVLWGCAPQAQRELKPGEKTITLTGAVVPFQEAKVTSATTGVVARLLVQPGQSVEAGAILLKLEPTTAIAEVDRAEAGLMVARTGLQQAQSGGNKAELATAEAEVVQLEHEAQRLQELQQRPRATNERGQAEIILFNAKLRLQRMYDLHARGMVSRPELEGAENEYAEASRRFQTEGEAASSRGPQASDGKVIAARLEAARARRAALQGDTNQSRTEISLAQVRQAEADLARARYNLTQTMLTAPITGIVTTVAAQVGAKVHEGATVFEIVDISQVKIKGDLSPGLLPFVFVGQAAKVTVNTVPPTALAASVEQFQRIADPKTQALAVTFTLPNPDYKFQPGFTAKVELPVKTEALNKQEALK